MCPIETCIMNDTLLRTNTRSSFCIQIYKPINSTVYNLISYDSKDLVILYFICSISINSKVSEDYCHTFKINCILKSWFCFNKESNYDILNKWASLIGKGNSIKKVLDLVKNRSHIIQILFCFMQIMSVQGLLDRIPLLISYPTIILSSNLIIPSHREVLQRGSVGIVDYEHTFFNTDHFIRLVLLPIFTASTFICLGSLFHVIESPLGRLNPKHSLKWTDIIKSYGPIFLILFMLSQLNFIQGSIQSTILSLLVIREYGKMNISNKKLNFSCAIGSVKIFIPLFFISLIIAYDPESYYYLFSNLLSYSIVVFIVLVLVPYTKSTAINKEKSQELKLTTDYKYQLFFLPLLSLGALLMSSHIYGMYQVQLLMLLVYVGCLSIFFLTVADIKTTELGTNGESNCPSDFYLANISLEYTLSACGFMAILLQYLSFNKIVSNIRGDIFTLVFVLAAECCNSLLSEKEQEIVHNHSHSRVTASEKSNVSLLKQIALNEDTRSIFSFLLLNTTFMFVQLLYSFRSKSLGLLSDSLHMALDCTSLLLGLIAGALSKNPPSDKFPFALKSLGTLAGFTNGILLLGIVCGIFIEALGRFFNPVHLHGTSELLVVAILGLLVNLVGLFAFDHAGHGHAEGAGHEENMKGIFLHILADTLGSAGVIVSTILIKLTGWTVFDPLASMFIASLILVSSIPLLKSSMNGILFKLDDRNHNVVKNALNQISMTPGITGYTTPRFWPSQSSSVSMHGHSHGHSHSHSSDHTHEHEHKDEHEHEHQHEDKHVHEVHKEHDETSDTSNEKLTGYIHVQYIDGENSTIIKKRVEKIFEDNAIRAWIQVEPQSSECWCRSAQVQQPLPMSK